MSANISDTIWSTGPNELTLRRNEVHVWRTSLNVPASTLWTFEQTLSDDERVKAEKFKFAKDRFHFIISRGVLRTILGRYLQRNPQTLCFAYSHHGKPMLILEPDYELLNFSVTHSHTMALYAVTYYQDVGIDMECVQDNKEYEQIAEHFFSVRERNLLSAIPAHLWQETFLRCWTGKEAFTKARGVGLSLALNSFSISALPGRAIELIETNEKEQDVSRWSLYDVQSTDEYVATLAIRSRDCCLKYWQFGLDY